MFDQGQYIDVGDARLFVAEAGDPRRPPVVLLHGGLGSRNDFVPLAKQLGGDFRLVAIDSRGHGRSEMGVESLSYRRLAEDVAAVLAKLGLAGAGVIGHSDGGIAALRLAASGLAAPRFVAAVAAHWHLPENDPARAIYEGVTLAEWWDMFEEQVLRYEAENPRPDFPALFEATRSMWLGGGDDAYPGESVRKITCPLLLVHGDEDFLVTRQQTCDLAEMVEGARLLNLPFASHTVLEDSPEDVVPSLRAFVKAASPEQSRD